MTKLLLGKTCLAVSDGHAMIVAKFSIMKPISPKFLSRVTEGRSAEEHCPIKCNEQDQDYVMLT